MLIERRYRFLTLLIKGIETIAPGGGVTGITGVTGVVVVLVVIKAELSANNLL